MKKIFQKEYASFYDHIYNEKNYISECNIIESIFRMYSNIEIHSILDLGCGTGNHSLELAQRNYEVLGVDQSQDMIDIAKKKQSERINEANIKFLNSDIRNINLNKKFEAVLMMFAVIGYINSDDEVMSLFELIRRHMNKDGLLIFDFWYGPAVVNLKPANRIKKLKKDENTIIRHSYTEIDEVNHLCNINFVLSEYNSGNLVKEHEENHCVKYFFPDEIDLLCKKTNFNLVSLNQFPNYQLKPSKDIWNAIAIAKAY